MKIFVTTINVINTSEVIDYKMKYIWNNLGCFCFYYPL